MSPLDICRLIFWGFCPRNLDEFTVPKGFFFKSHLALKLTLLCFARPSQFVASLWICAGQRGSATLPCTSRNHPADLGELWVRHFSEMISSPTPGLDNQERTPENRKRYSEIFRSLDAIEISIGNAYVEKQGWTSFLGLWNLNLLHCILFDYTGRLICSLVMLTALMTRTWPQKKRVFR